MARATRTKTKKPPKLGVVWAARASLMNSRGSTIAHCVDTPNAIAKALMKAPRAARVRSILGTHSRAHYKSRMKPWNTAKSGLIVLKRGR